MNPSDWNADTQVLATRRRTRFSTGWKNHLAADGWRAIDTSPRQAGGLFAVSRAPYSAEYPTRADRACIVQSTNRYDVHTRRVMHDCPVGITKRYLGVAPVAGIAQRSSVLYPHAFPSLNADRLIRFLPNQVEDLVVFNSEPPGSGPVEIPFVLEVGTLSILRSTGHAKLPVECDLRRDQLFLNGLSLTNGVFRGLKIKAPRVWDARGRKQRIAIVGRQVGWRFIGKKVIPRAFFRNATYPVTADAVTTFYPDPHPESTTVDGRVHQTGTDLSWADLRDGAGDGFEDSTTALFCPRLDSSAATSDTWDFMVRGIHLFDTAALSDAATISDAEFGFKTDTIDDNFDQSFEIVGSTPTSNTGLANGDYTQLGTTRYATATDLGSLTTSGYNAIPLNATGIAAIAQTGITKLGTRFSSDLNDSPPTWAGATVATLNMTQAEAGGSDRPYLEVTDDAVAAEGVKSLLLLGVGI